ncbi:protein THYLAKOID ASSEMBLY 8, chloroplastic [Impatiens glandulifera]|uniref:protein THYLAKOID ASSEMBLY 8, chloroplastic n=1 Tax=Impatiens glandulifera TaxID=253017 RepID=UPI001FB0E946|nr:protein THYLAKOID ASSEMBLY 8, chloroplastic [Impatiens glandulifera]
MASSLRFNQTTLLSAQTHSSSISQPIRTSLLIRCGPRGNRGPLVKGRVLSIEAIHAVQALKRAHRSDDPSKLQEILSKTLVRLIKADLIAAFNELLRQDRFDLAIEVFSVVRAESWYETNLGLYADLVSAMARKGMTDDIDRLMDELEMEGKIPCEDKGLARLVKALMAAERKESTVRIYQMMRKSGWGLNGPADEYVAKVLTEGLRRFGEERLAFEIDSEFETLSKGRGFNRNSIR